VEIVVKDTTYSPYSASLTHLKRCLVVSKQYRYQAVKQRNNQNSKSKRQPSFDNPLSCLNDISRP